MATTKNRGSVCSGNLAAMSEGQGGSSACRSFPGSGQGSAAADVARDTGEPLQVATDGKGGSEAGTCENGARN